MGRKPKGGGVEDRGKTSSPAVGGNGGGGAIGPLGVAEGENVMGIMGKRVTRSLAGKEVVVAGVGDEDLMLGGGVVDLDLKGGMDIDPAVYGLLGGGAAAWPPLPAAGGRPEVVQVVGPALEGRPASLGGDLGVLGCEGEGKPERFIGMAGVTVASAAAGMAGGGLLGVVPGGGVVASRPAVAGGAGVGRECNREKEVLGCEKGGKSERTLGLAGATVAPVAAGEAGGGVLGVVPGGGVVGSRPAVAGGAGVGRICSSGKVMLNGGVLVADGGGAAGSRLAGGQLVVGDVVVAGEGLVAGGGVPAGGGGKVMVEGMASGVANGVVEDCPPSVCVNVSSKFSSLSHQAEFCTQPVCGFASASSLGCSAEVGQHLAAASGAA